MTGSDGCRRGARTLALAAFCMLLALGTASAEVATVGALERASIATPHPYAPAAGADAPSWVIAHPGATYVRVHFSAFDLAPGDYLEVSDLDGVQRHVYQARGPHGTGEFWAFSVPGDTAVLRLQASIGGGFGFEVDSFGRGIEPVWGDPVQPESVCGTTDWKDVKCYEATHPTEYASGRGTVKALIGCCSACTAFKVSDSGQFMTNNHCTSSQSGVQSTELRFEYQMSACGGGSSGYSGAVMGSALLATNALYDYTLLTTTGDSSSIPCLQVENRLPPAGERIYIPGHPSGGVKKLSIDSTHASNPAGLCEVDASPYPGNGSDTDVGYYCDTTNGSSGSPVLSGDTHKVIALHHFGGCLNSGGRMDRIYGLISGLLDVCSGGGGGTCGNGTCDAGETRCSCSSDCGVPPAAELPGSTCSDGSDNDCDGAADCLDANCASDASCGTGCTLSGGPCTTGAQCCSGSCKGKPGRKTCR